MSTGAAQHAKKLDVPHLLPTRFIACIYGNYAVVSEHFLLMTLDTGVLHIPKALEETANRHHVI